MIRRSILAALAVSMLASFAGGCTTSADSTKNYTLDTQGHPVDPKTGIVLPGQGGGAGGGGGGY